MSRSLLLGLGAVIFMGIAASGYGQVNTTEGGTVPGHGRVNAVNAGERKETKNIAAGTESGQLTESEAVALKRKESEIQAEKTRDMMRHHGHLTKGEERHLKKEEKKLDRDIKKESTNADSVVR